jgi:iron uptake system component EfeO
MIKLRGAAFGFAVLILVAACGSAAPSSAGSSGLPSQDSSAPDASVPLAADSVATYRAYIEQNADLLVQRTRPFVDAVVAGKIAQARALYAPAREPYERIEPVAGVFGDLDPAIDGLESDVPAGGTFSGFHRLERALWQQNTTAGMAPMAKKLLADVIQVQALVKTIDLDPATIANGAVGLLNEISATKISGVEDRYSHTDLWDIEANVVGAQAAYNSVRPLVVSRATALATTIDGGFSGVLAALQPYQKGAGFVSFTTLTPADTQAFGQLIDALADPLSQVAAIVVSAQ